MGIYVSQGLTLSTASLFLSKLTHVGIQNVYKIWCSYHSLCLFNVAVTGNIFIFVDTKRNFRDLWENVKPKEEFDPENISIHGMENTEERRDIEDDLVISDLSNETV